MVGLGSVLPTANAGRRQEDIKHRSHNAESACHVNKWIFCYKIVSVAFPPQFIPAMNKSVVCIAAGSPQSLLEILYERFDEHC